MGNESQMRKDMRSESARVLYEDEKYMIGTSRRGEDEHHLLVNDVYALLQRGILNEWARAKYISTIRRGLLMVGPQILDEIDSHNIPLEELAWALAKARINEETTYSAYLSVEREDARRQAVFDS